VRNHVLDDLHAVAVLVAEREHRPYARPVQEFVDVHTGGRLCMQSGRIRDGPGEALSLPVELPCSEHPQRTRMITDPGAATRSVSSVTFRGVEAYESGSGETNEYATATTSRAARMVEKVDQ
jgi:hypothetical protein